MRRAYVCLLVAAWLSCGFAIEAPNRSGRISADAVPAMALVWLPVLLICSISTRRRLWVRSARLGQIVLTLALGAILTNAVGVVVFTDVLRRPLEGTAWTTIYITGLASLLIAPLGWIFAYALSRAEE